MAFIALTVALSGCAQGLVPQARNINIPAPSVADERPQAINDRPDSVIYLPLGRDVLVPDTLDADQLPDKQVGPFELRGETLGGALQLILSDVDIPLAFQTDKGLTQTVTVTNLKGKLSEVVDQVCSLADLYCSYDHGSLVVKDKETFTVTIPPLGTETDRSAMLTSVASAVGAITGGTPIVDTSSRTIIYTATSRTAEQAGRYFQRLRASTSLIVYETYVWEVSLDTGHSSGIQWDQIARTGNGLGFGISVTGTPNADLGTPISIGLPTKGDVNLSTGDVFKFISSYGAVKTISQPQITVLSGYKAKLRVADRQNYVAQITRTIVDNQTTVSTEADSVDSGFTLDIASSWDNATVYGTINILLQEVRRIDKFADNPDAVVQLPQTTERELQTQVRVRPGDSLLIAGLVREVDNADKSGIGLEKPVLPVSNNATASNVELVFLLKPRVIVFTDKPEAAHRTPVDSDKPLEPVPVPVDTMAPVTAIVPPKAVVEPAPAPVVDTPAAPISTVDQLFDSPVALTPTEQEIMPVVPPTEPVAANKLPAVAEPAPATAPVVKKKTAAAKPKAKTTQAKSAPATTAAKTTAAPAASTEALLQTGDTAINAKTAAPALPGNTAAPATTSPNPAAANYSGPITPSYPDTGAASPNPNINGQHKPATTDTAPASPIPPMYDDFGTTGGGV